MEINSVRNIKAISMFYQFIKNKWHQGKVSIGLSAVGKHGAAFIEGAGTISLAIKCLSKSERQQLIELAKQDALSERNSNERVQIAAKAMVDRLPSADKKDTK